MAQEPVVGRRLDAASVLVRGSVGARRALRSGLRDTRSAAWNAYRRFGQPRTLPDFLIVGAQRAGTTSLFRYLASHPDVAPAARKEVHFFDLNFGRGEAWYRAHFPRRPDPDAPDPDATRPIVGEASPYYLFHPLAAARAAGTLPEVRIIIMLREPVSRAYSHYHHVRACGFEHLPFEDALLAETSRLQGEEERLVADPSYRSASHQHHSYVARGRYLPQLQRWADHVPPERTLIVVSEEFYADPESEFRRVTRFLGLRDASLPSYDRTNSQSYPPMAEATRAFLRELYGEPNRSLAEWLGRALPWADPAAPAS